MAQSDDIPAPPWQPRGARRAQPRRQPITRDLIVDKAMEVFDNEGLDALSMRRLADELETGAASLYHHVANKDELLDLILNRVIGELEVPDPDPPRWREQVIEVARGLMDANHRHPDLVRASIGRWPMGENALVFSERMIAIFRAGGLAPQLAAQATWLLTTMVNGFALDNTASIRAVGDDAKPQEEMAAMVRGYFESLPADRFPNLTQFATEVTSTDPDAAFELLVGLFVDGLAARAGE